MASEKDEELKHKVPEILYVEVDPKGGPRIQEAAMRLYSDKTDSKKIHLLQGLQAVEAALRKFFYGHKQMLVAVIGSSEAKGNRALANPESCDSLNQLFLEPASSRVWMLQRPSWVMNRKNGIGGSNTGISGRTGGGFGFI